jgi:Berberine and berberine like
MDGGQSDRCIRWTKDTFTAMTPFLAPGRYVNYLGDDEEATDPVAAAYGPNYDRLRRLKGKYDPENVFKMNQNIAPLTASFTTTSTAKQRPSSRCPAAGPGS